MPAPDPAGVPDAGMSMDFSGDSVVRSGGENPDPSVAEMDALMAEGGDAPAPAATEGAAAPAAVATGEGELPPPPVAAAPAAPAPTTAEAAPAEPAAPAELEAPADPVAPAIDVKAESIRIRKGWADIARAKESLVTKTAEANAALASAQAFKAKADQLDALPALFASDPLGFLFQMAGKTTPEDQDAFVNDVLLDKVIEREKSPAEREIAKLRRELSEKEALTAKEREASVARAAEAENARVLADWAAQNTGFASATPANVEKYDLINSLDQGALVHQTIQAYYDKHKVILDRQVAADHVEARLRAGVQRSKVLKGIFAPPTTAAPAAAPVAPKQSNGTSAPKQTGTTTLSSVASGDGAPSAPGALPDDPDDRFEAVLRDMTREGTLPDEFRLRAS